MHKNSRIYVAGHTGLVGSAILRSLRAEGYKNILTRTHGELELKERKSTERFFAQEEPEYVFLAAAKVGGIYANAVFPAEFIYDNLMMQCNVIDLSYRCGVKKLLFLASSCIYPKFCKQPMQEEYLLSGLIEPTNEPFAIAKIAGIKICQAYNRQYKTKFISGVSANVFGVNDHFDKNAHVLTSLIKKFHEAKIKGLKNVTVWGTGRPKREFLYADDLADACLFLMERYDSSDIINIGTGVETSIKELAGLIKEITGFSGKITYDMSKPDGNLRRFLDTAKIKSLGWRAKVPLKEGLTVTYDWFKQLENKK